MRLLLDLNVLEAGDELLGHLLHDGRVQRVLISDLAYILILAALLITLGGLLMKLVRFDQQELHQTLACVEIFLDQVKIRYD